MGYLIPYSSAVKEVFAHWKREKKFLCIFYFKLTQLQNELQT